MGNDGTVRTRDGRPLHAVVQGSARSGPTVVFEAGMGASRSSWGAVAPKVAERTTTVVYDRSGLGRSPADPAPRDLRRLVDDHVDVLDHFAGKGLGPFVLVGHSWGGPIVRGAAARRPDLVAGLVLVDATDELCDLITTTANERMERWTRPLVPLAARLGLVKLVVRRLAADLPEPARSEMLAEDGTVAAMRTHTAESAGSIADLRRLRAEPETLPDVPVTLITGTRASSKRARAQRAALTAAHRQRAESLPQGRHVPAPASGHHVPLTDPALVAEEVLRLVDAVGDTGAAG
ncbi:MAG TPA: alpha/beta hydrolase [Acidimicrobiales bacterium]